MLLKGFFCLVNDSYRKSPLEKIQGHAQAVVHRGAFNVLFVGNVPSTISLQDILSPHAHPTDRTFCSSSAFKIKCGNYTQGN